MTDRELLEAAAKAAGMPHTYNEFWGGFYIRNPDGSWVPNHHWNPLTDDGDALRLAVRCAQLFGWKTFMRRWLIEMMTQGGSINDHCYATRLAIVRAAAAIGKEMK
jgi:hypothetical protein